MRPTGPPTTTSPFGPPPGEDPDAAEVLGALTLPDTSPAALSRRRFLQGVLATGGLASVGALADLDRRAAAAVDPLSPGDGIVVTILLYGGNDGTNTVVPHRDPRYAAVRGALSVAGGAHALTPDAALHPALPRLARRFHEGKVAVVRGTGHPVGDLSHFSSMASMLAGRSDHLRTTGWLGRWLDTVPGAEGGLRGVEVGTGVPLHLVGARAEITSLLHNQPPWGAHRTTLEDTALHEAVERYGGGASGLGPWGDAVGRSTRAALVRSRDLAGLYPSGVETVPPSLEAQLSFVARIINANLGVRAFGTSLGNFDTHMHQVLVQGELLTELDRAVDAFYRTLDPARASQVTLVTVSEFGRRLHPNGSGGTDHGTSSAMFVIGDRVAGGVHGAQPSLTDLDSSGNLRTTTDFRSVYASVLRWVGADPAAVLGGPYAGLELFRGAPGEPAPTAPPPSVPPPPPPPPPPVDTAWQPLPSRDAFVRRQYLDVLGRRVDPSGLAHWNRAATAEGFDGGELVARLVRSGEFDRGTATALRMTVVGTGIVPDHATLVRRARLGRADPASVARDVVASRAWARRFAGRSPAEIVDRLWRDTHGGEPAPSAWRRSRAEGIRRGDRTYGWVLLELAHDPAYRRAAVPLVDVAAMYGCLLQRPPHSTHFGVWLERRRHGTVLADLARTFLATEEYRRRVAG